MADPIKIRAHIQGEITDIRILMQHPMETGQRKDSSGNLVPAHFITELSDEHNGKQVLAAQFGTAVSKNPYLAFKFKGGAKGDKLSVSWVDNKGDKRTDEVAIN